VYGIFFCGEWTETHMQIRLVTSPATAKSKSKSPILKSKSKSTLNGQVQVLFKKGKSKSKSSRKKMNQQAVLSHSSIISLAVIE